MNETTLGSLMVQTRVSSSPRCSAATSQNRAKRSTMRASVQPPSTVAQRGVVKWWKLTVASMPCSAHAAHMRR